MSRAGRRSALAARAGVSGSIGVSALQVLPAKRSKPPVATLDLSTMAHETHLRAAQCLGTLSIAPCISPAKALTLQAVKAARRWVSYYPKS